MGRGRPGRLCALAVLLTGVATPEGKGRSYWVEFDNVFGLVEGGDLKLGGVKAGETTAFRLTDDEPYRVEVEIVLTEPGLSALRQDASCAVRQQSLIGEYYVDCQPGKGDLLAEGATVPVEQTSSTIPIDLVSNVMRLPYRERFRLIISELGVGLAGRPDDLSEVIRRAHPGLRETSQTLEILADQNRQISNFIRALRHRGPSRGAAPPRPVALGGRGLADSRRPGLARREPPAAVGAAARVPGRAGAHPGAARRHGPPADPGRSTSWGAQVPSWTASSPRWPRSQMRRGDRTPSSSTRRRPAWMPWTRAPRRSRVLRDLAPDAPKVGLPLRQLLESIDDRRRSVEYDPVAEELAPPAPDKTAYREGLGLTGMEAFWNYIYGQTLATNAFDEIGHVLRIVLLRDTKCSPYSANPSESDLARCGSFLGPYQPGLEEAKGQIGRFDFGPADTDPTDEAEPDPKAAGRRQDEKSAAGRDGEGRRRAAGALPDTPGRAGGCRRSTSRRQEQPDRPVLDRVLEGLRANPGDEKRRGPVDPLLDFLLGP